MFLEHQIIILKKISEHHVTLKTAESVALAIRNTFYRNTFQNILKVILQHQFFYCICAQINAALFTYETSFKNVSQ